MTGPGGLDGPPPGSLPERTPDAAPWGTPEWLAAMVAAWLGSPGTCVPFDDDPPGPVVELVLRTPAGDELGHAALPRAALRSLARALQHEIHASRRVHESHERMVKIAALLVAAHRAGEDVGEVLAAALNTAAGRLHLGVYRLTHGRPGSWEASIVREVAALGVYVSRDTDVDRVAELAELLQQMGQAKDDGGEVISQALGRAADEVGGVSWLLANSALRGRLLKLAHQHAQQ